MPPICTDSEKSSAPCERQKSLLSIGFVFQIVSDQTAMCWFMTVADSQRVMVRSLPGTNSYFLRFFIVDEEPFNFSSKMLCQWVSFISECHLILS